jgi:hypothetical protein
MMASDVEELTINFFEGDQQRVKELDKVVLTKGAWATILYRYQDWDAQKGAFGADKYSIRRYQKRNGEYMQKSKFNISSAEQARGLIRALETWIGPATE